MSWPPRDWFPKDWLPRFLSSSSSSSKRTREDEDAGDRAIRRSRPVIPSIEHNEYVDLIIQEYPSLRPHKGTLVSARVKFLELRKFRFGADDNLSEPRQFNLLWPTTTALSGNQGSRFFDDNEYDRSHFAFLGRSFVDDVLRSKKNRIFLYGPQGVGKSHILAAVALVKSIEHAQVEGALPICYIPDMGGALSGSEYLFQCLVQAVINQPEHLAELSQYQTDDIPSLAKWGRRKPIVFIADQCNAVGYTQTPKDQALYDLIKDSTIRLIFAASSNQTKVDVFSTSNDADPAQKILIQPFTEEEYGAFITTNFPDLIQFLVRVPDAASDAPATKTQNIVQEVTGFVPLQVHKLGCQLMKEIPLNENVVLATLGAFSEEIQAEVDGFLEEFFIGQTEQQTLGQVVQWMSAAASGDHAFSNQGPDARFGGRTKYVDWHFFYPQGVSKTAKPVSSLALRSCVAATVQATRKIDAEKRKEHMNQLSAAYRLGNPSVNGFIAEGLIIGCLTFCGLDQLNLFRFPGWPKSLEERNRITFPGQRGHKRSGHNFEASLLVPKMWNFPRVDSVLVYQHQGVGYIVGIQITLQSPNDHAHSLDFLLAKHHKYFVPQEYQNNYRVALLWIVPEEYMKDKPPLPQNAIPGVGSIPQNPIYQGAVSLEDFEKHFGVPVPRL